MDSLPDLKQVNPALLDLQLILRDIGICPCCAERIRFDPHEPFTECACGTGEWTGPPTIIERLLRLEQAIPKHADTLTECLLCGGTGRMKDAAGEQECFECGGSGRSA